MRHHQIIEKIAYLLQLIMKKTHQLNDPRLETDLFSKQLFPRPHAKLSFYIDECKLGLERLSQLDNQAFTWQSERLLNQCEALMRYCTQPFSSYTHSQFVDSELAQQLTQHHDYRQRLADKLALQQIALKQVADFKTQQQLLEQVDTTQQRLARCQSALDKLEWRCAIGKKV